MEKQQSPQYATKEAVLILKNGKRLISAIIYDIHEENRKRLRLSTPVELIYNEGATIPILKAFEFESDDGIYSLPVDDVEKFAEPWEAIDQQYTLFIGLSDQVGVEAASSILAESNRYKSLERAVNA